MKQNLFIFLLFFIPGFLFADNPLEPKKLDNPRETYSVFMKAMNQYKKGLETKDMKLQAEIDTAVQCLNLEGISYIIRREKGREAAIFLKEVIDRIAVLDTAKIPGEVVVPVAPVEKWTFPLTEIVIERVTAGDRENEFLFSRDTVFRAYEYYLKTKHLPFINGSGKGAGYEEPWVDTHLPGWMKEEFLKLFIWQWLGLIFTFLIGLLLRFFTDWIMTIITKFFYKEGKARDWQDKVIEASYKPMSYIIASVFWFTGLYFMELQGTLLKFINIILQIILSFNIIRLIYKLAGVLVEFLQEKATTEKPIIDAQLIPFLNRTMKVVIIVLGVLVTAQNLGVNVMSILAGLGVGGLALALAAKDTAANLFGSVMILLDRPFHLGDTVNINGVEGTVEEIGFRSTRIRTYFDSIVTIPNSEVANAKIDNLGQRRRRRTHITLGLTYDTPPEKLEGFIEGTKQILNNRDEIKKENYQVAFQGFGENSLDIMVHFYIEGNDWANDLYLKQNVFLEILKLAKEIGISFAFPTRTLHVENFPEKASLTRVHRESPEELKEIAKEFAKDGKHSTPKGFGIYERPVIVK